MKKLSNISLQQPSNYIKVVIQSERPFSVNHDLEAGHKSWLNRSGKTYIGGQELESGTGKFNQDILV